MTDELMSSPNDYTQNYPFCILKLLVETFLHSTNLTDQSKFDNSPQWLRYFYLKTLRTSKINSPMSPPSLEIFIPTDWHNNILYSQIQRNCLGINWNITSAKEFKIGENHHKIIKKD